MQKKKKTNLYAECGEHVHRSPKRPDRNNNGLILKVTTAIFSYRNKLVALNFPRPDTCAAASARVCRSRATIITPSPYRHVFQSNLVHRAVYASSFTRRNSNNNNNTIRSSSGRDNNKINKRIKKKILWLKKKQNGVYRDPSLLRYRLFYVRTDQTCRTLIERKMFNV